MINFKEMWRNFIKVQYEIIFEEDVKKIQSEIKSLQEDIETLKRVMNIEKLKEPTKLGEIEIDELKKLLMPHCNSFHWSDLIYGLTNVTQAKKFSEETKVFTKNWLKNKYDCDEFSFALMGYWNDGLRQFAFGIAWSKTHAFNIMVDDKKQVWIVEPQTNKFAKIENIKNNKMYYPLEIILI